MKIHNITINSDGVICCESLTLDIPGAAVLFAHQWTADVILIVEIKYCVKGLLLDVSVQLFVCFFYCYFILVLLCFVCVFFYSSNYFCIFTRMTGIV